MSIAAPIINISEVNTSSGCLFMAQADFAAIETKIEVDVEDADGLRRR